MRRTTRSLGAISAPETAVRSMRVLMTGYQLWGQRSRIEVEDLAGIIKTPSAQLRTVLAELVSAGLVSLDRGADSVTLTESGRHALAVERTTAWM